ncbi:MAG: hypothetical protein ABIC91_07370 [Nanoarchaeota archaeon]|nr:hypothetical protein [Nanoarchaeota archaeon]MBU1031223.1 hypothetical protein [Nanoarchaeota archaeon]MBU1849221.1 hypothetical protein [Nanoarchaeota archaeon]
MMNANVNELLENFRINLERTANGCMDRREYEEVDFKLNLPYDDVLGCEISLRYFAEELCRLNPRSGSDSTNPPDYLKAMLEIQSATSTSINDWVLQYYDPKMSNINELCKQYKFAVESYVFEICNDGTYLFDDPGPPISPKIIVHAIADLRDILTENLTLESLPNLIEKVKTVDSDYFPELPVIVHSDERHYYKG